MRAIQDEVPAGSYSSGTRLHYASSQNGRDNISSEIISYAISQSMGKDAAKFINALCDDGGNSDPKAGSKARKSFALTDEQQAYRAAGEFIEGDDCEMVIAGAPADARRAFKAGGPSPLAPVPCLFRAFAAETLLEQPREREFEAFVESRVGNMALFKQSGATTSIVSEV